MQKYLNYLQLKIRRQTEVKIKAFASFIAGEMKLARLNFETHLTRLNFSRGQRNFHETTKIRRNQFPRLAYNERNKTRFANLFNNFSGK